MLKKIAVVGGIIAVTGLGLGGAAEAWSGTPSASAATATTATTATTVATATIAESSAVLAGSGGAATSTAAPTTPKAGTDAAKKHQQKKRQRTGLAARWAGVSHAQWVGKDGRTGTFVTHDLIRGQVASVTGSSITVRAADGTSETFAVTTSTTVRVAGTKGAATISQVKVGDRVAVVGTGSAVKTATRVRTGHGN